MTEIGKKIWIFPDAFLPAKGHPYKTSKNEDQFIDTVGMRRMYDKWCQHLETRYALSSAY